MPEDSQITWKDLVSDALRRLGGEGHLNQINAKIKGHPKTLTNPTWKFTIRRVVRQYSIFQPVPPARSGVYRLIDEPDLPEPQQGRAIHGTVQGMLLRLGLLYGYDTFAPLADLHARTFQKRPLADFTTVKDCSGFCKSKASLTRVKLIDAIWLDGDDDGLYPAYAFEVENTTKVRSGLDRLTQIPGRYKIPLIVLAEGEKEEKLFSRLIEESRYGGFRERFKFRTYQQLENLFNAAVQHDESRDAFGVVPRNLRNSSLDSR